MVEQGLEVRMTNMMPKKRGGEIPYILSFNTLGERRMRNLLKAFGIHPRHSSKLNQNSF